MGEIVAHRQLELDRGFPWLCSMNPYLFLEQGEHILTNIAPLLGVSFSKDPDGDPFPAKELAASPLLEHLEEIRFESCATRTGDLEALAASPHLTRIVAWDVRHCMVTDETWEVFAANPLTRRCLNIRSGYEAADHGPIGEACARFDIYPYRYFDVSAEGRRLEEKYGYLPWLHDGNVCHWPDAHYLIEHKALPKYAPGSPADAPIKYGSGLWPDHPVEPREKFDVNVYDSVS